MRKKLRIPLIVLLIGIAAYVAICIPQWKTEDDIREAVFRYQLTHNAAGQSSPYAYYLSVGSADQDVSPSRKLLRRFEAQKPRVKPVSDCTTIHGTWIADGETHRLGIVLRAGRVRRISPEKAEIEGGYFENGCSASFNLYTVVRRHGEWVVVHDKLLGIS